MYVVFDLETIGFSKMYDSIIEIAAQILDDVGSPLEDSNFQSYIKSKSNISPIITSLTGISNKLVSEAQKFQIVGEFL